jgi:hypothetical protein
MRRSLITEPHKCGMATAAIASLMSIWKLRSGVSTLPIPAPEIPAIMPAMTAMAPTITSNKGFKGLPALRATDDHRKHQKQNIHQF